MVLESAKANTQTRPPPRRFDPSLPSLAVQFLASVYSRHGRNARAIIGRSSPLTLRVRVVPPRKACGPSEIGAVLAGQLRRLGNSRGVIRPVGRSAEGLAPVGQVPLGAGTVASNPLSCAGSLLRIRHGDYLHILLNNGWPVRATGKRWPANQHQVKRGP